jgi:hypothetical protein
MEFSLFVGLYAYINPETVLIVKLFSFSKILFPVEINICFF